MPNTQKAIDAVCEYRRLPRIRKGFRCEVHGDCGIIVGGNSSANFNVKFSDGVVINCHPEWKMTIFDHNNEIVYRYPDNQSESPT